MFDRATMKKDYSFGIIPLNLDASGQVKVLLIRHLAGHWAFPKGHADPGETPALTAERELKEETGLTVVRYLSKETLSENFQFTHKGRRIDKTVRYFIALVSGEVITQESEIQDSIWLTLDEAIEKVTFNEARRICCEVKTFLSDTLVDTLF